MSTSVNSQELASGSPASPSQMSALGLPGHKIGRKQFRNYISKVKHDAFAYANMVGTFYQVVGKGKAATLGTESRFKVTKANEKHLRKLAEAGKIILYADKTFGLVSPIEISNHTLKRYKNFVSTEFDMINDASKLGSKRSGVSTSGVKLTDEGYTFMNSAFVQRENNPDAISDDDLIRFAREHEIPDDKLDAFFKVYSTFVQALNLSLYPNYNDENVNEIFRGVISNTLSTRLLHLYRKIKYPKSPTGKYTTNNLIASMSYAYSVALQKAQDKINELAKKVGNENWNAYALLLGQYFKPQLTTAELAAVNSARTMTEQHRLEKEFKEAQRARILVNLRQYDGKLTADKAKSEARAISALTSENEFTNQTFMSMSHAILDSKATDLSLKSTKNSSIEKERKKLLIDSITSTEQDFTNYEVSNIQNIVDRAYTLITANDDNNNGYAVAAKYINNYIVSTTKFLDLFIKNNTTHKAKRTTKKHDAKSLASVML
jgi:hypothetical protein